MTAEPTSRGQMEVVGFVIIFGLVVAAIAILAVTGFGGLNDLQEAEKANNAVRAFEILDDNVDDIVRGRAPQRSTEVRLTDSRLSVGDEVTVSVTIENSSGSTVLDASVTTQPIEYAVTDDTTLIYMAGAVIRQDGDSAVMLEEPRLLLTENAVNVPIIQTRTADGQTNVGGSRAVNIRMELLAANSMIEESGLSGPYNVSVAIDSPYIDTWEQSVRTNRVYITTYEIAVRFE